MIPFPKIICGVSSGFVLCLSLSSVTQAASDPCLDKQRSQSSIAKCGEEKRQGIETIKGEVVGIEGNNYVVQKFYGKEVWLTSNATSKVMGTIVPGDHIEAKVRDVDNQKHVLTIHHIK
jgi:hypothetical protein